MRVHLKLWYQEFFLHLNLFTATAAAAILFIMNIWLYCGDAQASAGVVFFLDRGDPVGEIGGNIEELAAFLAGDLAQDRLELRVMRLTHDDLSTDSLPSYFRSSPPGPEVTAIVWFHRPLPRRPAGKRTEAEAKGSKPILLLSAYFPGLDMLIQRSLLIPDSGQMASAPLASVLAGMIRQEHLGQATEQTKPPVAMPSLPKDVKLKAEEHAAAKLAAEFMASYVHYPRTGIHLGGMSSDISYFPMPPLAVHAGGAYLAPYRPDHDRYRLSLHEIPFWAGGRYVIIHEDHEIFLNLAMLAKVTRLSFSDSKDQFPDRSVNRVNIGVLAGAGYCYFPLQFMGLGLQAGTSYTPQVQEYLVEKNSLLKETPYALRIMAGLVFDFFR